MRVVTFAPGGSGEPLSFLGRLTRNRWASPIFALLVLTSASAVAEILPADCARAAKYSESKRCRHAGLAKWANYFRALCQRRIGARKMANLQRNKKFLGGRGAGCGARWFVQT